MNMRERKYLFYQVGLSLGLLAFVVLQFLLLRQAWQARNQEFDLQMGAATTELSETVHDGYYCFRIYTEVEMPPHHRMMFLSQGNVLDTVSTFRFDGEDPTSGPGEYPLSRFEFNAPIHAQVSLNFDFMGSEDFPQVKGDSAVAWIDKAYENTVRDQRTGFRIIDTVAIKRMSAQAFEGILDSGTYAVELRRSSDDSLVYCAGSSLAEGSNVYSATLYDVAPFKEPYTLQIYVPGKEMIVLGQVGMLVGALLLVLAFVTVMFIQFSRLLTRQARLAASKHEFMNNMTHEFKTPIANIRLAVDTLSKRLNGHNIHSDILTAIRSENDRMNTNVDTILRAASLTDQQVLYKKEMMDVDELVEAAVSPFLNRMQHKGTLQVELQAHAKVKGDQQHLRNALQTILDNAIKYSRDGHVHIEVKSFKKEERVGIQIKDRGIGMDDYERNRIFEKFYRATDGNVHNVKGFGLGLYYARQVVSEMDGEINVQSAKGVGTTFTLWFPVCMESYA